MRYVTIDIKNNRLDLLLLEVDGAYSDAGATRIVDLNKSRFAENPTFWFKIGERIRVT